MATAPARPYFDQKLTRDQTRNMLNRMGAKHSAARSKPGIMVYKLDGEGEGMVEPTTDADKLRVRLFRGKCAC